MAGENAVIIKRIKKGGHDGHHGGAWKVAYADFVTAMMAFFLLMWLINTTTPEQKRGIADYFSPQSISQTSSGSGGVLGGVTVAQSQVKSGGTVSVFQRNTEAQKSDPARTRDNGGRNGGATNAQGLAPQSQVQSDDSLQRSLPSSQAGEFESAAESIRQAIQDSPDIAALSRQVVVDQTPEGLRIQLVDQDGKPMFQNGSAQPMPYARQLLATIAKIVDRLPNRISISGHTNGQSSNTDWQLSADRANAARALLTGAGVDSDRIYEVVGKAGSQPLLPENPDASANRRLSIVLLRDVPPVPAGAKP